MLRIKLLGIGCARHKALRANIEEALRAYPIVAQLTEITEVNDLIRQGISATPALIINDVLVFENKVVSVEELVKIFSEFEPPDEKKSRPKKILVPVDFSWNSENALKFAMEIAPFFEAEIKVLHVNHVELNPVDPYFLPPVAELEKVKKHRMEEFIRKAGIEHGKNFEMVATTEVKNEVVTGLPGDTIINQAKKDEASMIVMGTTGESNLLKKIFGSVSSFVAKNAHCPVLLVPERAQFKGFKKILYAGNYFRDDEIIAHKVLDFGKKFDADFHILHIETHPNGYPFDQNYYERLFEKNAPGSKVRFKRLEADDVVEGLNQYASDARTDLTVLLSRNKGFWQNLIHRSVTRRMSIITTKPLLIIHLE
ncbi:MAG TPA: universal stress protein [Saprospiraceae bacterium]|nr:universal stress protein [Saprospiraceae bacterium]